MTDFTEAQIQLVWEKAMKVDELDSRMWRKDIAGALICRNEYGLLTMYGWEIDHIYPQIKGGSDNLFNLQPLQWKNNRKKSDDYPEFHTSVTSVGKVNVEFDKVWSYLV